MKRADLTEFEIEEEDFKLRIKRRNGDAPTVVAASPATLHPFTPAAAMEASASAAPAKQAEAPAKEKDEGNVVYIKSPMVGTFYRAPSPESPAYVDVGDKVKADATVCIVEAMKVMNEIQAETTGSILEILVENGTTVEYGQPLFKVRPA